MYIWYHLYKKDLLGWYLIHLQEYNFQEHNLVLTTLKGRLAVASLVVASLIDASLTVESLIAVKHFLLPNQILFERELIVYLRLICNTLASSSIFLDTAFTSTSKIEGCCER